MMAFSAYRMTYAAIWDWRFNHIPLNRGVPFDYSNPELSEAVFTHRAGWGTAATGGYGDNYGGYGGGHHQHHHNGVSNGTNGLSSRKPVGSGVGATREPEQMV